MFRRFFKSLVLEPQVDDEIDEIARFQIPENAAFLTPTGAHAPTYPRSKSVRRYEGKYAIMRRIDGPPRHPRLPVESCWCRSPTGVLLGDSGDGSVCQS